MLLIILHCNKKREEEDDSVTTKYLWVKCGEWLKVGDHITYQCEIGNLAYYTSEIRKIVMDDYNPLKLDNLGFVRYHNSLIQKYNTLVNGRLENNPTSEV
jgi:hypothetical protein